MASWAKRHFSTLHFVLSAHVLAGDPITILNTIFNASVQISVIWYRNLSLSKSVLQVVFEVNPLSDYGFHSVASQFELLGCYALLWLSPEAETSIAQEDHCSISSHLFLVQDLQLVKVCDCAESGVLLWKTQSVFIYLALFIFACSIFFFNHLCSPDLGKTTYQNILKLGTEFWLSPLGLLHPKAVSPLPLKNTSYFLYILISNHLNFHGLHTSLWKE